jgi:hypothetical protein
MHPLVGGADGPPTSRGVGQRYVGIFVARAPWRTVILDALGAAGRIHSGTSTFLLTHPWELAYTEHTDQSVCETDDIEHHANTHQIRGDLG